MQRANQTDMLLISMGLDALLDHVRQSERWWCLYGDSSLMGRMRQFANAITATRQKFLVDKNDIAVTISQALAVADGLREAAGQCREGHEALSARLTSGAETIERLCSIWRD